MIRRYLGLVAWMINPLSWCKCYFRRWWGSLKPVLQHFPFSYCPPYKSARWCVFIVFAVSCLLPLLAVFLIVCRCFGERIPCPRLQLARPSLFNLTPSSPPLILVKIAPPPSCRHGDVYVELKVTWANLILTRQLKTCSFLWRNEWWTALAQWLNL